MATTAKVAKELKTPKFKIRLRHRCQRCGRPRAYMRKFALCRLCFRKLALEGDIAGVTKSSWGRSSRLPAPSARLRLEAAGSRKLEAGSYKRESRNARPNRRHAFAHPERDDCPARTGRYAFIASQGGDRAHSRERRLHSELQGARAAGRRAGAGTPEDVPE